MGIGQNARPLSIDSVLSVLPDKPSVTSRDRNWDGVTVDVHDEVPNYTVAIPALDYHTIDYCHSGNSLLVQRRDGVTHETRFVPGMSLLMPAEYDSSWDGGASASIRLLIPRDLIASAANQVGVRSASQFEIRNVFETRDDFFEKVALVLAAELGRPDHPAQRLISDTMSCALSAHLLRSYNAFQMPHAREMLPLSSVELNRIEVYVEENIERTIGLADLASLVNVSRFHFARVFKRSTGITAIKYVESCRMRRAQDLIAHTDLPLAQVALMAGFSDQSHFTRRFHRHVGVTPAVFARDRGRRRTRRPFD